jgi:hypothetical protein
MTKIIFPLIYIILLLKNIVYHKKYFFFQFSGIKKIENQLNLINLIFNIILNEEIVWCIYYFKQYKCLLQSETLKSF